MNDEQPASHLFRPVDEIAASDLPFPPEWVKTADLASFSPVAGATMRPLAGEKLMAVWVTIEPNIDYPYHQHPHEQLGVMIEGALELTLGQETRLLRPGDAYVIPSNLPHKARTLDEGCVVLDVFSPPREDYRTS